MNFCGNFELTMKTMKQFVDNMDLLKKMFKNSDTLQLFLRRFPFEKLLNITVMDMANISFSVKMLSMLSDYNEFYSFKDPFNYTMEFLLINLSQMIKDCEEICSLFQLLSKILNDNVKLMDSSFENTVERERILEVMLNVARFQIVDKNNFVSFGPILNCLLEQNFPESICRYLCELFENLKKHEAVMELADICKHILNNRKINCDSAENIYEWLTEKSPELLAKHYNEDLLSKIISCLIDLISYHDHIKTVKSYEHSKILIYCKNLYQNLITISAEICSHSSNPKLRLNCLNVLEFIMSIFFKEEKMPYISKHQMTRELNELPENAEKWSLSNRDIFFCICHMVIVHSRMIWKEQDVLEALIKCFYNRRYTIKTFVLKSIYFLYPVLVDPEKNTTNKQLKVLGDDLLNYFMKFSTASYLYSYNNQQLKWMLTQGCKSLKLTVLVQWMNTLNDDEILAFSIQTCQAESVLLELILDQNIAQEMGPKLASLVRKITNPKLSRDVAKMLPLTIDKSTIFRNLLLAQPGIPVDSEDSELICTLMTAIIPTLDDSELLKNVCQYISKLMASLKHNPNTIKSFCKNLTNVRYLIEIIKTVDDVVAIEIIRLLKVIIIVQKYNRVKTEAIIQCDFKIFIKGSTEKVEKALKLLYHMIAYKHSLITIEEGSVLGIYNMVLDYSHVATLHSLAYDCIELLLKRSHWLAQTVSSSVHIEMSCMSIYETKQVTNFLKMLNIWLRILKKEPYNGLCPVPEKAIKGFILRASLSKAKIQENYIILDELMKKQHEVMRF